MLVQGLITAYLNVTVPELDEIEQQHNVMACTRSWISTVNTVLPRYRDRSSSANTMLVRYHVPVLGPITKISVIRVLRYRYVPTDHRY